MQLDENYSLHNTENQWALNYTRKYINDKGKEVTTTNDYFYTQLSQALNGYIDKKLKSAETVGEAITQLSEILNNLKELGFTQNN